MTTHRRSHSCAACRFSRRCCSLDCPFAPYFPADEPETFARVHRLYGTGKISRILNLLDDDKQKQEAMISIKYESYIRHINPVNGCYGVTLYLKQKLVDMMRQLQFVRLLLNAYRRNKQPIQDSLIKSSSESLPDNNEIINDQNVDESMNAASTQTIYENNHLVGVSDRNANEVTSRRMESPSHNSDGEQITNAELMRILFDSDED